MRRNVNQRELPRVGRPGPASSGNVILALGTDLLWTGEAWSNARAKNQARGTHVQGPFQLRVNAYRVLLTRGRDGVVVFVPQVTDLDATAARLQGHGVKVLCAAS
jgi:hypothetical protein